MTHALKTHTQYFDAVWSGEKTFEVRKNDRDYKAGDILLMQEYDPETEQVGPRVISAEVTYRMPGGRFGIDPNYCVMSIQVVERVTK